eukprot:2019600-Rhodomonas_salina.1
MSRRRNLAAPLLLLFSTLTVTAPHRPPDTILELPGPPLRVLPPPVTLLPWSTGTLPSTFAHTSDAGDGLAGLSHCRSEGRRLIPSSSSPVSDLLPPSQTPSPDPSALAPLPVSTLNSIAAVSGARPSTLPTLPLSTLVSTSAPLSTHKPQSAPPIDSAPSPSSLNPRHNLLSLS